MFLRNTCTQLRSLQHHKPDDHNSNSSVPQTGATESPVKGALIMTTHIHLNVTYRICGYYRLFTFWPVKNLTQLGGRSAMYMYSIHDSLLTFKSSLTTN
jgi:hypothetical protein